MTYDNAKELIEVGAEDLKGSESLILHLMKMALETFVTETDILRDLTDITLVSRTVSFNIPTGTKVIYWVKCYKADGEESKEVKYSILDGKINFFDRFGNVITAMPSEIASIKVYRSCKPSAISLTDTIQIPDEFQMAIVHWVLHKYHLMKGRTQASYPNLKEYEKLVSMAKRQANTQQDLTTYNIG